MVGVTHFEKRGRVRKDHPKCPFCSKTWRVTPLNIHKHGGPSNYVNEFRSHLYAELAPFRVSPSAVTVSDTALLMAMDSIASFAVKVYDNC